MFKYILKRLLISIVILFGVSVIIYSLVRMMPADYVDNKFAAQLNTGAITQEQIPEYKKAYGIDDDSFKGIIVGYSKYIDMIKDIEDGGVDNIKDNDIDFLAYILGIINKEEWRVFDFYKHSPYGRIPKKTQEDLKNKIKLVIDDNLMELIEEKEQLIKELETSKRSNSIFF